MEYRKIGSFIKDIEEMKLLAMSMYQVDSESDFRRYYMALAMKLEHLTNKTRTATVVDADIDKSFYLSNVADTLGITITDTDGVIKITLPYLLPKRKSVDSESYIIEPLVKVLTDYVNKNKPDKIISSLVTVKSVYTPDNPKIIRDNDNIEIRHIINIISTMLFVDDNDMDILLCSRSGKKTHTEILISPRN